MRLHLEVEAPGEVDVEIEVFGCGNSRRHFPGFDPVVNREVPELLHHRNAVHGQMPQLAAHPFLSGQWFHGFPVPGCFRRLKNAFLYFTLK